MRLDEAWEREGRRWAAWARTPDHDSYWHFTRDAFLTRLPPPGGRVLDLACGEGRLSRDLAARGYWPIGIDVSPTLIGLAREADPAGDYRVANAESLPFDDGSFELVVAFNALMDFDDMPAAVRESARVLVPGGTLCASIVHPMSAVGRFASDEPESPYVITESYFAREPVSESFERDGLSITFNGQRRPLEDYSRALEAAGFCIEAIREPVPSDEAVARMPSYRQLLRIPSSLHLRARR
jgi:SAM-dependent methyltransferase